MGNVPKLRFSEFNNKWDKKLLGSMLTFKNGINASKEQYGKGYKFINVLDIINNNTIIFDDIIGTVSISEDIFEKNKVQYGDILFQRSSEVREEAGQSNVYLDKDTNATFGGFVIRGRNLIDYVPEFMNYMFKTEHSRKEITQKSNGSTRYNVGQDTLSKVSVFIPSLKEQEKIASFLSSVDKKIEKLEEKIVLQEKYKKAMMQKLFSQEIRFKANDGSDFPVWEEKQLKEVSERVIVGLATSVTAYYTENKNGAIPIIRNLNIKNGYFDDSNMLYVGKGFSEKHPNKRVKAGDVITVHTGSNVGLSCLVPENYDLAQTFTTLIVTPKENILEGSYLNHLLSSSYGKYQAIRLVVGGGKGNLNTNDFKIYPVPLPSFKEQQKIANFLSSLDKKIEATKKQKQKAQEFKKGLLQQMFV